MVPSFSKGRKNRKRIMQILKTALLTTSLLLIVGFVGAQNFPGISFSSPVELAPGVTAREGTSSSPRWEVRVFEVDMTERNINLVPVRALPGVVEPTSTLGTRARAVAAINGGYFGTGPAQSFSHFQRDGIVIDTTVATRPPRSVFGVSANHQETMAITLLDHLGNEPAPGNPDWGVVVDAIGAGPRLLSNGAVDVRDVEEEFDAASGINANNREPRTAVGFNPQTQRAWLVTVDGRQTGWSVGMTLTELAQLLQDLGATEGLNMDGGGSTTAWTADGVYNRPSNTGNNERNVINALAVVPSFVIDNTDEEFTTIGSWTPSANQGFYNTNSLFSTSGSGENVATWRPELARAGLYEVSAWWIGSGNRAAAAPYTVHHRNGSTLVPQDQRIDGSQWNVLGEFEFNPGAGGFVTLSNDVAPGEFVSADAVKFVLVEEIEPTEPTHVSVWMILQN